MLLKEPSLAMDLSELSFEMAVGQLEIDPENATIWVPAMQIALAYRIKQKYKCQVIAIPNVLAKNQFCWGVASGNGGALFWSAGVP